MAAKNGIDVSYTLRRQSPETRTAWARGASAGAASPSRAAS